MERKIGEIFEYDGKILRVKEAEEERCDGCLFSNKCSCDIKWSVGLCHCGMRSDKKDVIFVEAKDIAHETEAVKERKIGETFKYDGKTLEVVETKSESCYQCWFKEYNGRCTRIKSKTGECGMVERSDKRPVIFVEVKDKPKEQPHQKLNLCEILKDCPKGTELWSDNYGTVKFMRVGTEWDTPIEVELSDGQLAYYTEEGWWDKRFPANCLLYPSKDCRDWSKFSAPWLKKENKKNNVHFYVAREKNGILLLYFGKPYRTNSVYYAEKSQSLPSTGAYISNFGLNENDFANLKWGDEPVEVFLDMDKWQNH